MKYFLCVNLNKQCDKINVSYYNDSDIRYKVIIWKSTKNTCTVGWGQWAVADPDSPGEMHGCG